MYINKAGLVIPLILIMLLSSCASTDDLVATQRQLETVKQQTQTKLKDLDSRISSEKLLDLFNQVDELKTEVATLRGEVDILKHQQDNIQKRQTDMYNDIDSRLNKLDGSAPNNDNQQNQQPSTGQSASNSDYSKGLNFLSQQHFAQASAALESFLSNNPQSAKTEDAKYWLGIAYTGQKKYAAAIKIHREFALNNPDHPKAPEALRNEAICLKSLGMKHAAKLTFKKLERNYPNSNAAKEARRELASL